MNVYILFIGWFIWATQDDEEEEEENFVYK